LQAEHRGITKSVEFIGSLTGHLFLFNNRVGGRTWENCMMMM